jgi:hypothetical protein
MHVNKSAPSALHATRITSFTITVTILGEDLMVFTYQGSLLQQDSVFARPSRLKDATTGLVFMKHDAGMVSILHEFKCGSYWHSVKN